jgi:hypothetical protein
MAVMAHTPYTPCAAKVLRSAWMPAPAPESLPAMVRATGGVGEPERELKVIQRQSAEFRVSEFRKAGRKLRIPILFLSSAL